MTSGSPTQHDEAEYLVKARRQSFHPLEIIPYFRRWTCSPLRDIVYTFIWNTLIGLAFILISAMFGGRITGRSLYVGLVMSNIVGYAIHGLFMIGGWTLERWVLHQSQLVMTLYYAGMATLGVVIGFLVGALVFGWDLNRFFSSPSWYIAITVNSLVISAIIAVIYFWREKSQVAEMRLQRERTRAAEIERNASLAHLRMLQAQIEPHFLFNTLANVTSLIHPQPDKAKQMLEGFIRYLRASLASSREDDSTLGQEFALMNEFLDILKIRMHERLKVEMRLPADLAARHIPPMLIQPLVENAIKHGLEPKVEGGTLVLSAETVGSRIRITVADSGLGFSGATSTGVGLKNVRERLQALFGDAGKLMIEDHPTGGTRAILEFPAAEIR